jgi:transposase
VLREGYEYVCCAGGEYVCCAGTCAARARVLLKYAFGPSVCAARAFVDASREFHYPSARAARVFVDVCDTRFRV